MAEMKYFFKCDKCGREGMYCKECADKINSLTGLKGEVK